MSTTPMRDQAEAAEQRALEARSAHRDALAAMVGTWVRHAYTGNRGGIVVKAYVSKRGKSRVTVDWNGGKTTTHDLSLIRAVA